ncbi:hypothetical protein BGZ82_011412 [Podila clonocystis]|nr:hypothetical protein BGZ82_011412 [Podila clonocystis]
MDTSANSCTMRTPPDPHDTAEKSEEPSSPFSRCTFTHAETELIDEAYNQSIENHNGLKSMYPVLDVLETIENKPNVSLTREQSQKLLQVANDRVMLSHAFEDWLGEIWEVFSYHIRQDTSGQVVGPLLKILRGDMGEIFSCALSTLVDKNSPIYIKDANHYSLLFFIVAFVGFIGFCSDQAMLPINAGLRGEAAPSPRNIRSD